MLWGWHSRVDDLNNSTQRNKKNYDDFIQSRLKKSCEQFSDTAKASPKKTKQLHKLRIAGKNLRYTLELIPKKI